MERIQSSVRTAYSKVSTVSSSKPLRGLSLSVAPHEGGQQSTSPQIKGEPPCVEVMITILTNLMVS